MENDRKSVGAKIRTFFLGDAATSPEERKLVRKLDFFIMTYCCLSYFFNFLDRAAFANAYVAGLRESLNMSGDDYSAVLAVTTAGMAVGQLPNGIIIQKVSPRIWFPSMVVVWAGLTMASAAVKTTAQMCVIRFFLGLAEASTYGGAMYILGAWYRPAEIAKRTAIFSVCGNIGTMGAGGLMAGINKRMSGMSGLAGWQWVFLIDGIITLPVAIFGFLYFPDTPDRTKASYLSQEEVKLALSRVPKITDEGHSIAFMSLVRRVAMKPMFWILLAWSPICAATEGFPFQNNFLLWLKYYKDYFRQESINLYPLGVQAVAIIANLLVAWHMDYSGKRVPMVGLVILLQVVVGSMLIVKSLSFVGTFFAFYLAGTAYAVNPLIFGWANIILQRTGDDAMRSITLYSMNIGSMVLWTGWGILFYNAKDAPYWRNGCIALLVACAIMAAYTYVMWRLDRYTLEKFGDGQSTFREESIKGGEEAEKEKSDQVAVTAAPVEKTIS